MRNYGQRDDDWSYQRAISLREKFNPMDEKFQSPHQKIYTGGKVEHEFVPWEKDSEVCAFEQCGKLRTQHSAFSPYGKLPKTSEFGRTYWAWLLRHGGVYSYYGGLDERSTFLILEHLESCELRDDLQEPTMGTMDEFADTGSESAHVEAVVGHLQCVCGQVTELSNDVDSDYSGERFDTVPWAVKHDGLTLGQVMFQVINEL